MVVGGSCRRHLNVRAFRAETVSKNWEEGFQLKIKIYVEDFQQMKTITDWVEILKFKASFIPSTQTSGLRRMSRR